MDERDAKARIVTTFVALATAILVLFACSVLMGLRADVAALKDVLASKDDLVAVKTAGLDLSFQQRKCTTCHTERRFAGEHETKDELVKIIKHMEEMPDMRLTDRDVEKIHSSLTLLKCATCHSSEEIKKLALMTDAEQTGTIREMQRKPGSNISPDEVQQIKDSFQLLVGF